VTVAARQVAMSSVILLAENVVRLAAVAAVSFWIARRLGPAQFGILNFASALMAILLSVAAMGMDVPVVLRLTSSGRPGALMGTVLAIRSGVSMLVFVLAVVLAYGMKRGDVAAFEVSVIVSLSILGYIANAIDFWFKARTSAAAPALARTAAALLAACAKVACLLLGLTVISLAWTVVLESTLAALGLFWGFRWSARNSLPDELSVDRQLVRPLLRESMPFLFSSVAVLMYMKVDVVMLGYLSTNTQTGIYSLAQKLSEVIYVVPVVLVASAYPSLAKRFLDGNVSGGRSAQMLFDLAVGSSIIVVLVANLLAAPVIEAVFGRAYEPAVHIFYLHSWSCIAIAMNEVRHRWLAAVSLQRYAPTVTAIGLIMNLVLNLMLIPRWGALGAAITTVVSYFASGYLTSFLIGPLREFGYAQTRALWPWGRLYRTARHWHRSELLA
jgi:polysaccharide transporter, PST family